MIHDFRKKLIIEYANGKSIKVTKHLFGEQEVFKVSFSDGRPPLLIMFKMTLDRKDLWGSIPKGREVKAEAIGRLLNTHFSD